MNTQETPQSRPSIKTPNKPGGVNSSIEKIIAAYLDVMNTPRAKRHELLRTSQFSGLEETMH